MNVMENAFKMIMLTYFKVFDSLMMMKRLQSFSPPSPACLRLWGRHLSNCRHFFPPEPLLLYIELLAYILTSSISDILTSRHMQDPQRKGCRHSGHVLFKVTHSEQEGWCCISLPPSLKGSEPIQGAGRAYNQPGLRALLAAAPPQAEYQAWGPRHDPPRPLWKKLSSHI